MEKKSEKPKIVWSIIIGIVIFLSTLFGALAAFPDTTNLVGYYWLNESSGVLINAINPLIYNITTNNADYGATGKNGDALDYVAANSDFSVIPSYYDFGTHNISVAGWFKPDALNGIPIARDDDGDPRVFTLEYQVTGKWRFYLSGGAGCLTAEQADANATTGEWYFVVGTYDKVNVKIYVNGLVASNACSTNMIGATSAVHIGDRELSSSRKYFDGIIDEVSLWNKTLNQTEVDDMYAAGAGEFYSAALNFTIVGKDVDGTSVPDFTAELDGINYTTNNGIVSTIFYSNATILYDIKIWNANSSKGKFFNMTYSNTNLSSTLTTAMFQVDVNFSARKIISNESFLGSFNTSIGGVEKSYSERWLLTTGSKNVTFKNSSWYNSSNVFTITEFQNETLELTGLYDSLVTLRANNVSGGESIVNIYGNITESSFSYLAFFNVTTSPADNTTSFKALKGLNYTVFLTAEDYVRTMSLNTQNKNITGMTDSMNFTLYRDKSLQVFVRDIFNNVLLTNVTMFLYGNNTQNITFNESIFLINVSTGFYDVVVTKDGYSDGISSFTIAVGELINETIFMTEDPQNVVIYIRNEDNQYLSGGVVKIIRKHDLFEVASDTTDFSGGVSFDLISSLKYFINITREGYLEFYEPFNLIESTYTITLIRDVEIVPSFYSGFEYNFSPQPAIKLENSTDIDFSFDYSSVGTWSVTGCWLYLIGYDNETGLSLGVNTTAVCDAFNGTLSFTNNTLNFSMIEVQGVLEINGTANVSYKAFYAVSDDYKGSVSLMVAIESLFAFDKAGFGTFGKVGLVMLFIVGMMFTLFSNTELISGSDRALLLLWAIIGMLSTINLINLDLAFIKIDFIKQWGIFLILTILTLVVVIKNMER